MTIPMEIARRALADRIKAVLRDHLCSELEEIEADDAPGLNLEPPSDLAYYILGRENSIKTHNPSYPLCVYIYPFDEIDPVTSQSTGGGQRRLVRYDRETAVTVRLARQAGDLPFDETDPDERDLARLTYYISAIANVLLSKARDGRAITLIKQSRIDEDLELSTASNQSELFGRTVFDITQRVSVKQHNAAG